MINALLTQLPVGPSNLRHNALLLPHQSKLDDSRQIGSRQRWSTVSYMGISNLEFHVLGSAFCDLAVDYVKEWTITELRIYRDGRAFPFQKRIWSVTWMSGVSFPFRQDLQVPDKSRPYAFRKRLDSLETNKCSPTIISQHSEPSIDHLVLFQGHL